MEDQPRNVKEEILSYLVYFPNSTSREIYHAVAHTSHSNIQAHLFKLEKLGKVQRVFRGDRVAWRLT